MYISSQNNRRSHFRVAAAFCLAMIFGDGSQHFFVDRVAGAREFRFVFHHIANAQLQNVTRDFAAIAKSCDKVFQLEDVIKAKLFHYLLLTISGGILDKWR